MIASSVQGPLLQYRSKIYEFVLEVPMCECCLLSDVQFLP